MNFDWFAEFDVIQVETDIDNCVNGTNKFDEFKNVYSQTKLLATCLNKSTSVKNYAKSGDNIKYPKGHKLICKRKYDVLITEELKRLEAINLYKPSLNISAFPLYSFFLQFEFSLATPYISKDDEEYYICENPIRKEKVFKVPMVSGSNWKGNMRWVAKKTLGLIDGDNNAEDSRKIVRLFGNEKGNEKEFRRGRLNFYPTFLNKISLEVINPHDRKTKAGTIPVYIESVPEGATGVFSLLYMPFDLMGRSEQQVKVEVKEDMSLVNDALEKMMLTYGFSAKKSSGFGIVKNHITITYKKMRGIKENNKEKPSKKPKSKNTRRVDLKDLGNAMEKRADTFDNLKEWFESVITELEKPVVNEGGSNG